MSIHLEPDSALLGEITAKATPKEQETWERYKGGQSQGTLEAIEVEGRKKFFQLRSHWSYAIIAWITFIILFNVILSWQVGAGHWNFEKYPWFLTGVIAENITQIIGLGYLVVKFLFPKSLANVIPSNEDYPVVENN